MHDFVIQQNNKKHMLTLYLLQFLSSRDVGDQGPRKNSGSHIDASHSRQPLVKGERLVRYEVNAVMLKCLEKGYHLGEYQTR